MTRKINSAVMFGSSDCPACLSQVKMIKDHLKFGEIVYYDLKQYDAPEFITERDGSYSMPTWVLPDGTIHKGVITNKRLFGNLVKKRTTNFGASDEFLPQLGVLAKYGKDWPNGQGLEIPNSFMTDVENKWGTGEKVLDAGLVGRELGPGNTDKIFSQNYFYQPRMSQPGGQLGTFERLNRTCNIVKNPASKLEVPGMFPDSTNQQIVGFGKKKRSQFGKLYNQMGPAYGSQYIVDKDTIRNIYGGGLQDEYPRPQKVNNKDIYIGQAKVYNPLNVPSFGLKKSKKRVIKEGTVLTLKKGGKIKIRN